MAEHFGYSAPAYLAAFFSLSSAALTAFYLKEHQHVKDETSRTGLQYCTRIAEYLKINNLRAYLLVFLFFALPFSLYVSMASLYMKLQFGATAQQVGLFLGYVGLLGIIYQGALIRPLVKKMGDLKLMRAGMLAMTIGLVALFFVTEWWQLFFTAAIFAFGTGVTRPTLTSLIISQAPPNRRGGVGGVSSMIESASRSVAPVVGGWIIGWFAPHWIGLAGGLLSAVGLFFAFSGEHSEPVHTEPHSNREYIAQETEAEIEG